MKGVLYYFSGTGNTAWASEMFKKHFKTYGVDIDIVNIEKANYLNEAYDILIIGTPIYYGESPKIVSKFVKTISSTENKKKCILYCTCKGKGNINLGLLANILRNRGFQVEGQVHIDMPYNFKLCNEEAKEDITDVENILRQADLKIKKIVKDSLIDKPIIERNQILGSIRHKLICLNSKYRTYRMIKNFNVTRSCSNCGLCLRNCPEGNITFDNNKLIFHSNCMLCMRCMHICPNSAITFKGMKIIKNDKLMLKLVDIV
ncbi:4Fe-4S binding protein [Clostridium sp. 19966]|uniref:EFR1 family ferrodoxin n=1 Tax=Clostridium sp. 19966 TaxID=2768166 RepID=UPI0028DE9894|nr:EFR1 family ferrodoxin [Clostridium sp. 19966]MDT8719051.1 4Fe-4S binding protein [Clostridium sp. 19966]